MSRSRTSSAFLSAVVGLSSLLGQDPMTLPLGEPIERVECAASEGQSYALYLPSNYTPEKRWPILYCFDPRRRGMIPLGLFREAAERHGFILVSSNNFVSDQPTLDDSLKVIIAVWNDSHSRLSIDVDRIYSTGFSGGARISWVFDYTTQKYPFAGIIGIGAGFPSPDSDRWGSENLDYYGLVGQTDFNYYEMMAMGQVLDEKGIPNRTIAFDGAHQWPPLEECSKALDWMRIRAVQRERAAKAPAFIDRYYERELAEAGNAETRGLLIEPFQQYAALVRDVDGLRDISEARERWGRLSDSKPLRKQLEKRKKEAKRADQYIQLGRRGLGRIEQSPSNDLPTVREMMFEMRVKTLLKRVSSDDVEESLAARRVIESHFVQLSFYIPRKFPKDFQRSRLSLSLATEFKPDSPFPWLGLARVECRMRSFDRSVKSLRRAVELGFEGVTWIENQPDLSPLRDREDYKTIVADLKARARE